MSNTLSTVFNLFPFGRIRRNHALEHATLQVLARRAPGRMLAGYSDASGFWIVGNVSTEDLLQAADEAVRRLRAGEHSLAVHPACGTNFVVSGLAAGSAAWLATLGGGSFRKKLDRWPFVVILVTLALILAAPLGPRLQAQVTTDAEIGGLQIAEIARYPRPRVTLHRVRTKNH